MPSFQYTVILRVIQRPFMFMNGLHHTISSTHRPSIPFELTRRQRKTNPSYENGNPANTIRHPFYDFHFELDVCISACSEFSLCRIRSSQSLAVKAQLFYAGVVEMQMFVTNLLTFKY